MNTAEEFISNIIVNDSFDSHFKDQVIIAMKMYAKQASLMAVQKVQTKANTYIETNKGVYNEDEFISENGITAGIIWPKAENIFNHIL